MMLNVRKKNRLKSSRYLSKQLERLAIGESLPSLRKMIIESGIGRLTLEKSLQTMISKGYVEVRDRSGIYKLKDTSDRINKLVIDVICCSEAGYLDSPNSFFSSLRDRLCFQATSSKCLIRMHQVRESDPLSAYEKLIIENDVHFALLLAPHTIEIEKIFTHSFVDTVTVLPRYQVSYGHAIIDSPEMVTMQMNHLFDLGHKQIAFIGEFIQEHPNIEHMNRMLDYYRIMAECGHRVYPHWSINSNYDNKDLFEKLSLMFSENPAPTAVICCDMALNALYNFLINKKLRIGKDISVISCDNLDHLRLFPEPTSVINSLQLIAHMAWSTLENIIRNTPVAKMQYVPLSLKIGNSTCPVHDNNQETQT